MRHPTLAAEAAATDTTSTRIVPPYYPIVYVRGYAMTHGERAETFHDTYYGFAATSVEKRDAAPPDYFEVDVFEGQLIRFMKLQEYYADATNRGFEAPHTHAARSLWVCRFYDQDYVSEKLRSIEDHAEDLRSLVCEMIPAELEGAGIDLGPDRSEYRVILIAHSMGGLVCRTLIQNLLPARGIDPASVVHRLVTLGTPHRGIDLGRLPDFLEHSIVHLTNLFDAGIFQEPRMRDYLKLSPAHDVHSLGGKTVGARVEGAFPIKRCLNIIGSDHASYTAARHATGAFSDGLVKQDRAYMVSGGRTAAGRYPDERQAYWANVHRAHSGRRGIVNSYESFENIQRFLFGNIIAQLRLDDIAIRQPTAADLRTFYDFELTLTIRGTVVYLHRRQQDPCENAIRVNGDAIPDSLLLHTTFMSSGLKVDAGAFSHFALSLRVVEHRIRDGFLMFDRHYPGRPIYQEALEIRVGDADPERPGEEVEYRSFSTPDDEWTELAAADRPASAVEGPRKEFRIPLRNEAFSADLVIRAGRWPDPKLTLDGE